LLLIASVFIAFYIWVRVRASKEAI
jgi:hypothetical protein